MSQELLARGGITRAQFAKTEQGERVYKLILEGSRCEVAGDSENQCPNLAIESVHFDVLAQQEFRLSCGENHSRLIRERIDADLARQNRSTIPGKNGFGRS